MNIPRTITIKPVLNGYVVRVGCQSLAFTSREDLLNNLKSYLTDPTKTETAYLTGCMHRDLLKENGPIRNEWDGFRFRWEWGRLNGAFDRGHRKPFHEHHLP